MAKVVALSRLAARQARRAACRAARAKSAPPARRGCARRTRSSKAMRPSLRTRIRSARRIASSTSWVTSRVAGPCALAELADQPLHLEPGQRIERCEGLVEEQQLRLANQRAGERCALRFAARERRRPSIGAVREIDFGERCFGARACRCCTVEADDDILPDLLRLDEPRFLEHHRAGLGHPGFAVIGRVEAGKDAQQRRLAAARGAEQRDELAGVDG